MCHHRQCDFLVMSTDAVLTTTGLLRAKRIKPTIWHEKILAWHRGRCGVAVMADHLPPQCSTCALTGQVGSGPRKTAKPCEQRSQMGAVFLSNASEFQPHSASALHVAHNSPGSDLPFLYEKINLCFRPNRLRCTRLNKDSLKTQVPNARNIATSCATPIHSNPLRRFDAQSLPPREGWHLE
jgi:hypothetical protein